MTGSRLVCSRVVCTLGGVLGGTTRARYIHPGYTTVSVPPPAPAPPCQHCLHLPVSNTACTCLSVTPPAPASRGVPGFPRCPRLPEVVQRWSKRWSRSDDSWLFLTLLLVWSRTRFPSLQPKNGPRTVSEGDDSWVILDRGCNS